MMVVVTGNSTSSPVKPKKPPAAPLAADISVCDRVDAVALGVFRRLPRATRTDFDRAPCTAEWTRRPALSGSLSSADSSGLPTMFVNLATIDGDSRRAKARFSAAMSSGCCSMGSIADHATSLPTFRAPRMRPPGSSG